MWDEWAARTIKTPMTIGHEYMGHVAAVGAGVTTVKPGDRVTGEGHLACGHCRNCRRGKKHVCENTVGIGVNIDGSFAEYVRVPAENVILLDPRIPDDWAAIMDPFGNATHTALSFPVFGMNTEIAEKTTDCIAGNPDIIEGIFSLCTAKSLMVEGYPFSLSHLANTVRAVPSDI